jgi:HEAT repeat protein
VAAPLGGTEPAVVFAGSTGFIDGVEGERAGPMILAEGDHVYVGRQRENRSLCGRPAMLAPKVVHPDTLALSPVKLQRLTSEERSRAERLVATPVGESTSSSILRASWATSAADGHPPSALVDADPKTAWVEGRGGVGRGEFVVLLAPKELPISGFEIVFRPDGAAEGFSSPTELWIAADGKLLHVSAPNSVVAGGRYVVAPAEPLATGCVALVLESAPGDATAGVGVAEIAAMTSLSEASVADLVKALDGSGAQASAAAAALRSRGGEAFDPIAGGFESLGEVGRRAALDVMDHAAGGKKVPVVVQLLFSPRAAERVPARERIRDCGSEAAPALVAALGTASEKDRSVIAEELAVVAPETTVRTLVAAFAGASADLRRSYRVAVALASRAPKASTVIDGSLRDPALDPVTTIDLLRALGPRTRNHAAASTAAFARLATTGASFRTRYLLLGVASELASVDPAARAFLLKALTRDESAHVRARAARVASDSGAFRAALLGAVEDEGVRVREAAVESLGEARAEYAATPLAKRLVDDHWPLVRSAAATALGRLRPSAPVDQALVGALDDESATVRRPALLALGAHKTISAAGEVRERLADRDETPSVRAAAALALGMMCDSSSVGTLTSYARGLADPQNPLRDVAQAALTALSWIDPSDLAERIAPLRAKGVGTGVRQAADAALSGASRCGGARGKT